MTRSKEIDKVASTYAIDVVKDTCNPASKRGLLYAGFVDGAEWADRTMIEKACEWLDCYIDNYLFIDAENKSGIKWDDFINDFLKAMKGGEK